MRISHLFSCLLLSSTLATPLFTAAAEQAGASMPDSQACRAEIQKLCGNVKPGDGRMQSCLEQNRTAFSPACQQQMAEHRERAQQKAEACRADVAQFCQGIEPGGGRLVRCLKQNEARLSPACRDGLARHGTRSRDRREPQP